MQNLTNQDTIDYYEIQEFLDEAMEELQNCEPEDQEEFLEEHESIVKALEDILSELDESSILVSERYFKRFITDELYDIYDIDSMPEVLKYNLDWDQIAEDCKQDYTTIELGGNTFYYRAV